MESQPSWGKGYVRSALWLMTSDGQVDAQRPHPMQVSSFMWAMGTADEVMGPKTEIYLS